MDIELPTWFVPMLSSKPSVVYFNGPPIMPAFRMRMSSRGSCCSSFLSCCTLDRSARSNCFTTTSPCMQLAYHMTTCCLRSYTYLLILQLRRLTYCRHTPSSAAFKQQEASSTRKPSAFNLSAASWPRAMDRLVSKTRAPAPARALTVSYPIPLRVQKKVKHKIKLKPCDITIETNILDVSPVM